MTKELKLQDINGNQVKIGDTIKVLHIRRDIPMADDERPHIINMLGKKYQIDDIVNNGSQISVSISIQNQGTCMWLGLYLFPSEFSLVQQAI